MNFLQTMFKLLTNILQTMYELLTTYVQASWFSGYGIYESLRNFLQTCNTILTDLLRTSYELLTNFLRISLPVRIVHGVCGGSWRVWDFFLEAQTQRVRWIEPKKEEFGWISFCLISIIFIIKACFIRYYAFVMYILHIYIYI